MVVASMLGGLAVVLWLVLMAYLALGIVRSLNRPLGQKRTLSIPLSLLLLVLAVSASTLASSIVVVDAGEVGVVFNVFTGTQRTSLSPGMHVVAPYVNTVHRYSTMEQVYTMSIARDEGQIRGDDSLWSPTREGLQVGIDSSTRYAVNPVMAWYVHEKYRTGYNDILIRPSIRSIVRLYVSQNTVTDVYGPKRKEIQAEIESALRQRLEAEGFTLLSFDIRNVNFTEDYARAIEQKQIAQQQAEQMQFVLQKERLEAERKQVEAEGAKQAAIIRAQGEAESLRLVSQALSENPSLLTFRYIEKLAPNISVMLLPSDSPFLLDLQTLKGLQPGTARAPAPAGE
ncbi:MAG: prohibitin family protein [Anaerolineae bacterium]